MLHELTTPALDLAALRADTPGCEHHIHLNNAGSSLMPAPVMEAIHQHLELEGVLGGYEAAADRADAIRTAYTAVATLLAARSDQVAFTENATAGYAAALSSVPFAPGDVILTTSNDYVSNQIQFLSLRARFGVQVIRAPDRPEGGVDPRAMADLIERHRPALVCVTHVPTNSGLIQPVAEIGVACRRANVLYLVDACQSVGQMRVSPEEIQCDYLSATFRKFLRGPRGVGFLYVSDRVLTSGLHPIFVDLRGAQWTAPDEYRVVASAARFETWEFAWSLVLGAGAAAAYAARVGLERIEQRVQQLAARLRAGLGELQGIRLLDRGAERCGIVSLACDEVPAGPLAAALRAEGIHASAQTRPFALLDYDRKGVSSSLRLSPHYFNSDAEVDRAVEAIASATRHALKPPSDV